MERRSQHILLSFAVNFLVAVTASILPAGSPGVMNSLNPIQMSSYPSMFPSNGLPASNFPSNNFPSNNFPSNNFPNMFQNSYPNMNSPTFPSYPSVPQFSMPSFNFPPINIPSGPGYNVITDTVSVNGSQSAASGASAGGSMSGTGIHVGGVATSSGSSSSGGPASSQSTAVSFSNNGNKALTNPTAMMPYTMNSPFFNNYPQMSANLVAIGGYPQQMQPAYSHSFFV